MSLPKDRNTMDADDETSITEIELMPDGRIYLFGASRQVLEAIDGLQQGRNIGIRARLTLPDSPSSVPPPEGIAPP